MDINVNSLKIESSIRWKKEKQVPYRSTADGPVTLMKKEYLNPYRNQLEPEKFVYATGVFYNFYD
jgi:hypothetical protein